MPAIHLTAHEKDKSQLVVCTQVPPEALASDGTLTEAQLHRCLQAARQQMPGFSDEASLGYYDMDCFVFTYLDERSTPVLKEIYRWADLPANLFRSVLTGDDYQLQRSVPIACNGFATLDFPQI